jgi:hypothetical protein
MIRSHFSSAEHLGAMSNGSSAHGARLQFRGARDAGAQMPASQPTKRHQQRGNQQRKLGSEHHSHAVLCRVLAHNAGALLLALALLALLLLQLSLQVSHTLLRLHASEASSATRIEELKAKWCRYASGLLLSRRPLLLLLHQRLVQLRLVEP